MDEGTFEYFNFHVRFGGHVYVKEVTKLKGCGFSVLACVHALKP